MPACDGRTDRQTDRQTDGRTDVKPIAITCFSIADARNDSYCCSDLCLDIDPEVLFFSSLCNNAVENTHRVQTSAKNVYVVCNSKYTIGCTILISRSSLKSSELYRIICSNSKVAPYYIL